MPPLADIADHIRRLLENGWLAVAMDDEGRPCDAANDLSLVWRGWFRMTAEGKRVWESAAHFADQEA